MVLPFRSASDSKENVASLRVTIHKVLLATGSL